MTSLRTEWVRYGRGNRYSAYLAVPSRASGPLPAVVVIQEVWGADEHIQDVTRRFAQAGYVALAPDLYARDGVRPAPLAPERIEAAKRFMDSMPPTVWVSAEEREQGLAKQPEPEQSQLRDTLAELFGGLAKLDTHVEQLRATVAYLHNELAEAKGQPVGSVGFCMGGALSALLACSEPSLRAAVIFYGNSPDASRVQGVNCPVLGFYAERDPRITNGVPAFADAMRAAGKRFEYHVYEGALHAFFNDTRAAYNPAAARDAFARTLQFFNAELGGRA
ncbi:MAG: dienelactone hydrolase family protein [Alicyclobacillaceae bacterium]|nr:dienelactone hydrolase family protein [Alicyclobacillaceae bacterium]